ncbi:hypothetical protein BD289DRAFT_16662 [Coniella lustricola]|uniref:Uncharacterized protein n=1 Tax=Coniella lustricola TaxID=2025994 RepID=A0A2T3A3S7_9PEZI|nr:hypothetical protein BD289DRAFT_16662 [Coniella lustricola]
MHAVSKASSASARRKSSSGAAHRQPRKCSEQDDCYAIQSSDGPMGSTVAVVALFSRLCVATKVSGSTDRTLCFFLRQRSAWVNAFTCSTAIGFCQRDIIGPIQKPLGSWRPPEIAKDSFLADCCCTNSQRIQGSSHGQGKIRPSAKLRHLSSLQ